MADARNTYVVLDNEVREVTPATRVIPDMRQALTDLRELKDLYSKFGVELVGCLTSIAEGAPPQIVGEISNLATDGASHAVAHFKLAEHLHRCLVALRAWNADLHVTHQKTPAK
jgi:hypothetical protein